MTFNKKHKEKSYEKRIFLILAIVCCIFGITGCTKKQNKSPKKQQKDVNGFFNTDINLNYS